MIFKDRKDAGKKLAAALGGYKAAADTVILGLPRGGVVTAYELASKLGLPLDIVVPRKIGAPGNPEFAIGAIAEDGRGIFNEDVINRYGISKEYIEEQVEKENKEANRRLAVYRGDRPPLDIAGKTVILIDDGIATGSTMKAAIESVRAKKAARIVVAVPVSAPDSLESVKEMADEVVCLYAPFSLYAIGQFFENFSQVEDEEVIELLEKTS